ncbi:unnamed protein product [Calypogeia fissa]
MTATMGWELSNRGARTSLKWVSFVAALWLMACVGTQDTFSVYSPVLKAVMNYDQFQLMTLSGAKETGKGFGLLAGVCSFFLPLWVMLTVSAVESVVGFGFLWLVVSERIAPPPYKLMYVILWIAGNSITWMNTAAIVVSIQNFPFNRGTVVGILKGLQALSAAIYIQLGTILFTNNVESFFLLLAFLPASSCIIAIILLRRVPPVMSRQETHEDRKTFSWIYISAMVLALFMLTYNISSYRTHLGPLISNLYLVLLALFVAAPLVVPIRTSICSCVSERSELEDVLVSPYTQISDPLLKEEAENTKESVPLIADSYSHESQWMHAVTRANQSSDIIVRKKPPADETPPRVTFAESNGVSSSGSQDDITVEGPPPPAGNSAPKQKRVLKKIGTHHFTVKDAWGAKEFWLLFFSFFCGIGMSITLQNNLSQMAEALGYTDVAIFLTIFTVATFFGRVLGGGLSELFIKLAAIPRPFLGAIVQAVMVVCYIQLALAFPLSLFMGTFFAGITAGVQMTIAIATASELFGLKFIGMLYNFLLLVYPLAGNLFSGVLVGKLYDYESHKVGVTTHLGSTMTVLVQWAENHPLPGLYAFRDDESEACVGAHCFCLIFFIMAGVSALGVVLNLALLLRIRRHYRSWYWSDSVAASSRAEEVPPAPLLISHS